MTALVLTLNSGSSSLKFALFDLAEPPVERLRGQVDGIGTGPHLKAKTDGETVADRAAPEIDSHGTALDAILALIEARFAGARVEAVGHRIVHGGPDFDRPAALDAETLAALERLVPFAPLHQPHNLAGVQAAHRAFPEALQIGCFDTSFHRVHPWVADTFALPRAYYDKGIRRYGFHGLSYDYVSGRLAEIAPERAAGRVVIAHLGNGASLCAVKGGRAMGSTMGFTALDGLPMGTRTGQIDPGVILYLMEQEGMTAAEISDLVYRRSGLLGLSGLSNDMRTLEEAGTEAARAAIAYFTFRIRREIGAMTAVLEGIDALVFTAGIGENSVAVRRDVCAGLGYLGVALDEGRNAARAELISTAESPVAVFVVPTNEEMTIARAAVAFAAARAPA
ncbi:MAG: acetate/propionate family kinase [Paracoccaceae bacterium]